MHYDKFAPRVRINQIHRDKASKHAFPYYNASHQFGISKLSLGTRNYYNYRFARNCYSRVKHTLCFDTHDFSFPPFAPQMSCRNLRKSRVPEIPTRKYRKFSTSSLSKEWSLVGIVTFINFFFILFPFHGLFLVF